MAVWRGAAFAACIVSPDLLCSCVLLCARHSRPILCARLRAAADGPGGVSELSSKLSSTEISMLSSTDVSTAPPAASLLARCFRLRFTSALRRLRYSSYSALSSSLSSMREGARRSTGVRVKDDSLKKEREKKKALV